MCERDSTGRFLKGQSGNPGGRPKGRVGLKSLLLQKLDDPSTLEGLVKSLIEIALSGDIKAHTLIWNYIEGKPEATMNLKGDGVSLHILEVILPDEPEPEPEPGNDT